MGVHDIPKEATDASQSLINRPEIPLILLPGLGGDARLFGPQRAIFPNLIVPDWIAPEPRESLSDYARRFASVIDPGKECIIGGVSFGGVVALEVATHIAARECLLFGSIRDPRQIPRRLQIFQSVSDLVMIPKWLAPIALACGSRWMDPVVRGILIQLREIDPRFVRWAAKAILNWKPSAGVSRVPVFQTHGDGDFVFPIGLISPNRIVSGGGHLISVRNSKEVNQIIQERISAASSQLKTRYQ